MKNIKLWLGILAIMLVFGITVVGCDNDTEETGGTGGGVGGNGKWRIKKLTMYTVTNGVAGSVYGEDVYNWITYRYTSDTNYEYKYTYTGLTATFYVTRNGQNYTYERTITSATVSETYTITELFDSESGLILKRSTKTQNSSSGTTTTEFSFNIQLISDSGGVKTYKVSVKTATENGKDISNQQGYSEYKVQNGRRIELKSYSADGVLTFTATYTLSDNPVIKAKLGNYTLSNGQTVEVLSDSATELVIREKGFSNNVLLLQRDITYEKVN
jgi:hypothetical protein